MNTKEFATFNVFAGAVRVGTLNRKEYDAVKDEFWKRTDVRLDQILWHAKQAARFILTMFVRTLFLSVMLPVVALIWISFAHPDQLSTFLSIPRNVEGADIWLGIAQTVRTDTFISAVFALGSLILSPRHAAIRTPHQELVDGYLCRKFNVPDGSRIAVIRSIQETTLPQ